MDQAVQNCRMNVGRPIQFDPDVALQRATETFWAQGYEATSLQALLSAMGLSKSSLYQCFGDKAQLFQRCLRHYCLEQSQAMRQRLAGADSPMDFIATSFREVADAPERCRAHWGCLLMNTATELGTRDPVFAEPLQEGLMRFRGVFQAAVEQAQGRDEIPAERDPEVLAHYLVSSMSGLKTMAKAGAPAGDIRAVTAVILRGLT